MSNLFKGYDWGPEHVTKCYKAIEQINEEELGLSIYPNQFEIVSSEQMLDAYSSVGMPIMYRHWSFGKQFARESHSYKKGHMGLALELVINSSPCVNYLLEDISATECAAVIAHAAIGHNSFFKNNYMFKTWTEADAIVDYLLFAKKYIEDCEEKYGYEAVEMTLDSAHALQRQGVSKYKKPGKLSKAIEIERQEERQKYLEQQVNDLWRTIPKLKEVDYPEAENVGEIVDEPEENILYFLEKKSPVLKTWQREIIRIVRKVAQYFYPQIQTKVMNEGTATYCHFYIMTRLREKNLIDDGQYMEFLQMHSSVVYQPPYSSKHYSGFNPYRLGFEIFRDMERICKTPDAEDYEWFPEFAGKDNFRDLFKDTIANYRDESFIRQFLGPKVMREYKLFRLTSNKYYNHYSVDSIHDQSGFASVRKSMADSYLIDNIIPEIQVVSAEMMGSRKLVLEHHTKMGKHLKAAEAEKVVRHIKRLWGYEVVLKVITTTEYGEEYPQEFIA